MFLLKNNDKFENIIQEQERLRKSINHQKEINKIPGIIQFFFGSRAAYWLADKLNIGGDLIEQERNYN